MKILILSITILILGVIMSCSTNGVTTPNSDRNYMGDPSACYCEVVMGYGFIVEKDSNGAESGYCILPNNEKVSSWAFFRGQVAQEYTYCNHKGLKLMIDTISTETGFKTPCPFCFETNSQGDTVFKMTQYDLMRQNGDTCAYSGKGKGD
ncbi:MAG: DUF333 domain-containing protein [bacterium]